MSEQLCFNDRPDNEADHEDVSPALQWAEQAAKHALDDLFNATLAYRSSQSYFELMHFVSSFRFYSPYNAMLLHVQRPGATYVAPSYRWRRDFKRRVKATANPLVILQPMGPVMFVFDVADTEPGPDAPRLPSEVTAPYEIRKGTLRGELDMTIENAKRDGVRVGARNEGSQSAGHIRTVTGPQKPLLFSGGRAADGRPRVDEVPLRYEVVLNDTMSREAQYATLGHELAHLYCGHVGSPNPRWWPDRRGLLHATAEFEAESVCYLVCTRLGIDNPSDVYLANYVKTKDEVPAISLECVMKAAGLVESMGRKLLNVRKKHSDT